MPYYDTDGKLTFDEADALVETYLRERAGEQVTATSVDVLVANDLPRTTHNTIRVHDALKRRCELVGEGQRQRFAFPDTPLEGEP